MASQVMTASTSRPPVAAGVAQKRRKPSGEVSHICPYCNRSFKRSEHKERHVRTHTKEKPFVCHCGHAFARRDLLTRHQRINTHHDPKLQTAHAAKPEQGGVNPAVDNVVQLQTPVSPPDMANNPWDQFIPAQSNDGPSDYGWTTSPQTGGAGAPDEQFFNHQMQQHGLYYPDYSQGQPMSGYTDPQGFYDDRGTVAWTGVNPSYFQNQDTSEVADPQLQEQENPQLQKTISIII
ncbi:hypothetical protein PFICI_11687 [Pestalotiopsis fici W106-1]|uniref:C2H2-type domain-containing protein n=1 Tax=Pestalotiopsis fici (strain W106-1 / CGMCC3.15140) TaxID=1229662 RepID=W3WR10_PESFW|nr:uncharacterized protein PFICI_11687 [Pestalotiopsis fici W106-1]ETS76300.1 hypothetical protein PFICI_11687 [Pestalotiopsis fici W106-1]